MAGTRPSPPPPLPPPFPSGGALSWCPLHRRGSPSLQLHGEGRAQDPALLLLHLHGAHQHAGLPEGAEAQVRVPGEPPPRPPAGCTAPVGAPPPAADVPSVPTRPCCRWRRTSSRTWVGARGAPLGGTGVPCPLWGGGGDVVLCATSPNPAGRRRAPLSMHSAGCSGMHAQTACT